MSDKSHVSMEQHVCIVCGTAFDTGSILLDKRLHNSMERYTITGYGKCPTCLKLEEDGYIALIGVDESKSVISGNGIKSPADAYRTGSVLHIKKEAFAKIITGVGAPPDGVLYVQEEAITLIKGMIPTDDITAEVEAPL